MPIAITRTANLIQLGMYAGVILNRLSCLEIIAEYFEPCFIDFACNGVFENACLYLEEDHTGRQRRMIEFLLREFESDEDGERLFYLSMSFLKLERPEYLELLLWNADHLQRLARNQSLFCLLAEKAMLCVSRPILTKVLHAIDTNGRWVSIHHVLDAALSRGDIGLILEILEFFGPQHSPSIPPT